MAHGSGNVSPTHQQPLPPQETFLILISLRGWVDYEAIVLTAGLTQWKIQVTPSGTTLPQPTSPLHDPTANNIVINTPVCINKNIWSIAQSTSTHLQHINLCIIWLGENGIHCMQQLWRQPQRIIFWLKVGLETVISNKLLQCSTIHQISTWQWLAG